jgi:hypothetical protein
MLLSRTSALRVSSGRKSYPRAFSVLRSVSTSSTSASSAAASAAGSTSSTSTTSASASTTDWPVERVRNQFVEYFSNTHAHTNVKSSPCVPVNDPTLLFANAGMWMWMSMSILYYTATTSMQYYAILLYNTVNMLCYAMLCYAMLCYPIPTPHTPPQA